MYCLLIRKERNMERKKGEKLPRDFYLRDALTVARDLLGKILVHQTPQGILKGKIVEVEAYMGKQDAAAHSCKVRSPRTEVQYGVGGFAYIYLIYGMYYCMNIVSNREEIPEVVLLRALEPLEGLEQMQQRRNVRRQQDLCNGPGKLCSAMDIQKAHYGIDLCGHEIYLEEGEPVTEGEIGVSKRINIDYAGEAKDYEWRFFLKDNPYVSGYRKSTTGR